MMDKFDIWYKKNEWKFTSRFIVVPPEGVKISPGEMEKITKRNEPFMAGVKEAFRTRKFGSRKPLVTREDYSNRPAVKELPFDPLKFKEKMIPDVPYKELEVTPDRYVVHSRELARQTYRFTLRFKILTFVKSIIDNWVK